MSLTRRVPLRPRNPYRAPRPVDPIPAAVRNYVRARDNGCVGRRLGFPGECWGGLELDHVRSSGGMGLKSESVPTNLVVLCSAHHRYRTEHGRETRPLLLDYLAKVEAA